MNLPNALTVSRIILAPIFFLVAFLGQPSFGVSASVVLWLIFVVIEITDIADGYFARRQNLVTGMGKVLDPFADVVSHLTFFLAFVVLDLMPPLLFLIIMYREVSIIFLRLVMFGRGIAMAARIGGKLKTWFYAVSSAFGLFVITGPALFGLPHHAEANLNGTILLVLFISSALLSVASLGDYLLVVYKSTRKRTT